VFRNGIIEAVGAGIATPKEAWVIDGQGLTVYPGLIDMGSSAGLDVQMPAQPQNARTREEVERWKRQMILRPQIEAASHVRPDAVDLKRLASAGITNVLAVPPGSIVRGMSSLLNVAEPDALPQYGTIADERRGRYAVRTPVALHVSFQDRAPGDAYPASLMGVIAFVRQALLDAGHYQLELARYESLKRAADRPVHDHEIEALQPVLAGRVPVAFEAATALEIRRALAMAAEFSLTPIITGGLEADQVVAEIRAQSARVILSLNFPARSKMLAPDADETLRVLRTRANAPKVASTLQKENVLFAFQSGGLKEPRDFVRNAARAVQAGLPPDAAVKALTINAAAIAGAAGQLGSLEKGKLANLIVTSGDLFDEKMTIKHVFVDGAPVIVDPAPPTADRGRGRR
ncbi:MAG: amidohydrolase family protein, partial [Planctomycetes bacterium]|nr:amidohydrolase family protein [Planctomycetota bacterium]